MKLKNLPEHYLIPLKRLVLNGFFPLKITTLLCEDTFIFATEDQQQQGFSKMELNRLPDNRLNHVTGFWYNISNWEMKLEEYVNEFCTDPIVYDLDQEFYTDLLQHILIQTVNISRSNIDRGLLVIRDLKLTQNITDLIKAQ